MWSSALPVWALFCGQFPPLCFSLLIPCCSSLCFICPQAISLADFFDLHVSCALMKVELVRSGFIDPLPLEKLALERFLGRPGALAVVPAEELTLEHHERLQECRTSIRRATAGIEDGAKLLARRPVFMFNIWIGCVSSCRPAFFLFVSHMLQCPRLACNCCGGISSCVK